MKKNNFIVLMLLMLLSLYVFSCKNNIKSVETVQIENLSTNIPSSDIKPTNFTESEFQKENVDNNLTDTILNFPNANFSIKISKSWEYTVDNNSQTILYATKSNGKNQFSIHLTSIPDGSNAKVIPESMPQIKQGIISSLESRNCVVKKINIKIGDFKILLSEIIFN